MLGAIKIMKHEFEMDKSIELSKGITIVKYLEYVSNENKSEIANMIYQRFYDRYLKPYSFPDSEFKKTYKNGFSMMASSCLMIETYMAFKKGIEDTESVGRECFCDFFNSEPEFIIFKNTSKNSSGHYLKTKIPSKFYYNIRCGILHQGETKEGWKITRKKSKPLFDVSSLTLNAYKFMEELNKVLKRYKSKLETEDWNSEIWLKLRTKMDFVINNCQIVS